MKPYRIIIAGSRTVPEKDEKLFSRIERLLATISYSDIEIVSGTCKGADILGENFAKLNGLPIKQFPADWSQGKKAGYLRNKQMAEYSTHLIAIWDGQSKGTKNMIDLANEHGLKVRIIIINSK